MGFNGLTDAEIERLSILSEELGEVQQIIGKIMRHGYDSHNPFDDEKTPNRKLLEKELGDVLFAISFMVDRDDIDESSIEKRASLKRELVQLYLHHNSITGENDG